MAAFGLSFAAINEESQLHGTINGQSSLSSNGSLSNNSTDRSPSSTLPATSATAAAVSVPAVSQSAASSSTTSSSVTTVSSNSPATVPSTSPSFKPAASSYDSHSRLIAGYPRLPGFYSSTYSADQNSLYPTNSPSFYPSLNYDLDKPNGNSWTPLASQSPYSPYDHSFYSPYSNCYGTIDSAARRKNATRETTNTLKAWLYEHRKNPYPTKGEKIMLAIITKMTLTQVSTWFANARRRLKKENKMTWEPKNKSSENRDDSDKDSLKDIDDDDNMSDKTMDSSNGMRRTGIKLEERSPDPQHHSAHHHHHLNATNNNNITGNSVVVNSAAAVAALSKSSHLLSNHGPSLSHQHHNHSHLNQQQNGQQLEQLHSHPHPHHHHHHHPQATLPPLLPFGPASIAVDNDNLDRPKIWSLAQTATSAEATSLAAARLYPEWSAAYAFQHQSNNVAADNMLINPFPEHYHHHHHSNNNNNGNSATGASQPVQSLPGNGNFYGKSTANGAAAGSIPSLPVPVSPAAVAAGANNSWVNEEPQHNLHHLGVGGGAGCGRNGHPSLGNGSGTFACSPVSFLSERGNSVMASPFTPATVAASIQQHQFFLSQQQKHRAQISTT